MQVVKNNITQFLSLTNTCFMIPVYQRNYDWTEENCKQLWSDLWYVAQHDGARTHFLGTICSKTVSGHEKTIIDGQQRITTITLLVKAMLDYVDNEDFKRDLDSSFIHNNGFGVTQDHRVKLHLNRRDDAIYNKLLDSDEHVEADALSAKETASRVYQNYDYFYQRINGLTMEQIVSVRSALDSIIIVDLDVETENPQEIFESLNSTGLDLTDVDLLRNFLLMSLEHKTQTRLYDQYWYKIEENVHPDNMVRFFVDYLIFIKKSDSIQIRGRRGHINENNLYTAFKDYYRSLSGSSEDRYASPEVTEEILKSMLRYSKSYKKLVFNANIDQNKLGDIERAIYSIVYINQSISSRPVLLYIMDKYLQNEISHDDALEMLNACLSITFRAKVAGSTGINGQFAGNMLQRLPDTAGQGIVKAFWRAITSGSGKFAFPSDKVFSDALMNRQVFDVLRSKGTKYMLYTLEQKSVSAKGLPRYDDPNITVEHVMPKTLTDEWRDYLGEDAIFHDTHLNLLGNLTLTSNNPEMSNKSFGSKQAWYKQSSFSFTRQLAEAEEWSIESIRNRCKELTDKCLETWPMPAEYQPIQMDELTPKRRPPFRFSMVGLEKGDEILYINDPSRVAIVEDDSHVRYEGQVYSLSGLATLLLGRDSSNGIAGPLYFTYDGQTLAELRDEIETNMY